MKKMILIICAFAVLIPIRLAAAPKNTSGAVSIAKAFCAAVYQNDMTTAKSYMCPDDARRTPQTIRGEDLTKCKEMFRKSSYKVIPNEWSDQIVTVRFYDPSKKYLSKQNRWFCCSVQLVYTSSGWKVTSYGY